MIRIRHAQKRGCLKLNFEIESYTKATKNQGHHLNDLDFFVRVAHDVHNLLML